MRSQRGVSMVELLVVISLTGLIAGALTSAIATGLRTTEATTDRLQETQDAHLTTIAFVRDAQSADAVSLTQTSCSGLDPLVLLSWTDDGVAKEAAYAVRAVDGRRVLSRWFCQNGGGAVRRDVAQALHATTDPAITCVPNCAAATRVEMLVTEASGWTFTAAAERRTA